MKLICFIVFVYIVTFILPFLAPGLKIDKTIPFIVGGMGVFYQLVLNRNEKFSDLGFKFTNSVNCFQVLCLVCAIMIIVATAGVLLGKLHLEMSWTKMLLKLLINIPLLVLVITPLVIFTEELVFRGIIQRQLIGYMSPLLAIIIASLLFGLWHIPFGRSFGMTSSGLILYVLGTGMVGFLAGIFYYQSKSLILPGFLHGLWNAACYTIFGIGSTMPGILQSDNETITHPEQGLVGVFVLVCSIAVTLLLKGI